MYQAIFWCHNSQNLLWHLPKHLLTHLLRQCKPTGEAQQHFLLSVQLWHLTRGSGGRYICVRPSIRMLHNVTMHALYSLPGAIDLTPLIIHLKRTHNMYYVDT